jgi:cytochrome c2
MEGFKYSPAMRTAAARPGDEGKWTYEELNRFLSNPQADIRGTRMNFPGLRRAQDRANIIAWLAHPRTPIRRRCRRSRGGLETSNPKPRLRALTLLA